MIGGTSPLNFRISAGGSKCQQSGVLDRTCSDNDYFKNTSKHLHINDVAEKRKQVTVTVDIHQLGSFTSKPSKVISKPSKKKQSSVKHLECKSFLFIYLFFLYFSFFPFIKKGIANNYNYCATFFFSYFWSLLWFLFFF